MTLIPFLVLSLPFSHLLLELLEIILTLTLFTILHIFIAAFLMFVSYIPTMQYNKHERE